MNGFYKFITNPDWWSVIATIIAAVIAACITYKLGKRQNELHNQQLNIQKRQNELQEQQLELEKKQIKQNNYEIYHRVYECISNIELYAETLIYKICISVSSTDQIQALRDSIYKLYEELDVLHQQFHKCSIDIEFKLSDATNIEKDYYDIINEARILLVELIKIVVANKINVSYDATKLSSSEIALLIDYIVERCENSESQYVYKLLNNYSQLVKKVVAKDVPKDIRKRYWLDNIC